MIRQLFPWYANLKKRQVKAPKVYLRDTGLLHHLLGIRSEKELLMHPKCGASWEGYVIAEILHTLRPDEAYYWATHNGAEIDLVMIKDSRMFGVECKRLDAPRLTPSMKIALHDLRLERILVIYPGTQQYKIADRIIAVPFKEVIRGEAKSLLYK
jgi:predicted AAA+ superfamily ATPase